MVDEERNYYTPQQMLAKFHFNIDEAIERVLPLFSDIAEDNKIDFINRILGGDLQSIKTMRKLIKDLKNASEMLVQANQRGKKGKGKKMKVEEEIQDPEAIPSVGSLRNVSGSGMNCLIRAILTGAGIAFDEAMVGVMPVAHLVANNAAGDMSMLDLAGLSGAVLISYLVAQGALAAQRGLVVFYYARPGVIGYRVVVEGANPINLWLSNEHFQLSVVIFKRPFRENKRRALHETSTSHQISTKGTAQPPFILGESDPAHSHDYTPTPQAPANRRQSSCAIYDALRQIGITGQGI